MAERTVTIASKTGLHARPAGIFAKAAEQQPATVTIEKPGGNAVQASSMLMLMTLGAAQGDEVTLRAEGEGAEERSEEHTSELQSRGHLVCRLLLEKKK